MGFSFQDLFVLLQCSLIVFFYQSEIRMRKLRRYPPFADLVTLTVSGADEGQVLRACLTLRDALRPELTKLDAEVLGPAGAPIVKVNNRYRYRLFLVAQNTPTLRKLVSDYLIAFHKHRENRSLDIFADCNAIE